MLKVETLESETQNEWPDPVGDVIEVMDHKPRKNRLIVLTQIDGNQEIEESVTEDSLPFDPGELSVSELRSALADSDLSADDLTAILQAEENGKGRSTATASIKEAIDRR